MKSETKISSKIDISKQMNKYTKFGLTLLFCTSFYASYAAEEYKWTRIHLSKWENARRRNFFSGQLTEKAINLVYKNYQNAPESSLFFYRGKNLFSFTLCSFDLFEVKEAAIEQKYKFYNRGYTCLATPFVRDSVVYTLGGEGLWVSHMDLIRFDELNGSWEFTYTKNQPLHYYTRVVFQNSKGVYALFGIHRNLRDKTEKLEPNGYFLDWSTKEWKRLRVNIEGNTVEKYLEKFYFDAIETQDYLFFNSEFSVDNMGWNIIEKETGKILLYDLIINRAFYLSPYTEVIGNTIHFQNSDGQPQSLNIKEMAKKSKVIGQLELDSRGEVENKFPIKDFIYILLILALLGILAQLLLKYRKNRPVVLQDLTPVVSETEGIIEQLMLFADQQIDSEKLDKILGIHNLENIDTRRLKRSRLIIRINELYEEKEGKQLIVREKSQDDKRFVFYKIQK